MKQILFWIWFHIWHVMYCFCFPYNNIFRRFLQFITLCEELKNDYLYSYKELQSIYLKNLIGGTTQNKFYFNNRQEMLRNNWFFCIALPQVEEDFASRNFGVNSWKILSRILLLVIHESLSTWNICIWVNCKISYNLRVFEVLIYRLVAFSSLSYIFI